MASHISLQFPSRVFGQHLALPLALWFSVSLAASPGQSSAALIDPQLRDDTYAIYSMLLTDPGNSDADLGKGTILIVGTTQPGTEGRAQSSIQPPSCIRPSSEYDADWREILAEVSQYTFSLEKLEPLFRTPGNFILLSDGDLNAIKAPFRRGEPLDPKFQGSRQLFSLSHVFFNSKHTLALTEIGMSCGGLCGHGGWRILEKVGGKWQTAPHGGEIGCVDWEA